HKSVIGRLLVVIGRALADTQRAGNAVGLHRPSSHRVQSRWRDWHMTAADDIARFRADWIIWRSDLGRWWATRRGTIGLDAIRMGCAMTLDADDPETLAAELAAQERLLAAAAEKGGAH